jgi:aminoglycoside phosphotransferase (APT) family kinase protein
MQMPDEKLIRRVAHDFAQEEIQSIKRFPTGLVHYVYDVVTKGNRRFVVRVAAPENRSLLESGVYWSKKLRPLGVPLPEILYVETGADIPYVVLERVAGKDLGEVYSALTSTEKREIAASVNDVQQRVSRLPSGSGFGFVSSYESGFPASSWSAVVDRSLARTRRRIESACIVDASFVEAIEAVVPLFDHYFNRIQPTPFLDDITTKNVMISDGRLTGVVDVDQVCFGDPIFTIALTRMALMSTGAKLDYVEYWCDRIQATRAQRSALSLYSGVFCIDFMSEIGQRFNKDNVEIDWIWLERLKACHAQIIAEIKGANVS